MKTANIAEFKKHLSAFIELVEKGETVEICRRNVPVARLEAIPQQRRNHTVLGCGEGSVIYHGRVDEPLMPIEDWEMLNKDGEEL